MQERTDLGEMARRLTAALDRIGKGIEPSPPAAAPAAAPKAGKGDDLARLQEELEVEKAANAQLAERLKAVRERDGQSKAQAEARIETMTRQLDLQGLELARLRKTTVQLREALRMMSEGAAGATPEPHLINKAMLAELEALRALRQSEASELDEILAALDPLVKPAEARAGG
ncbi:MAG TPA: hypothetical protein PKD10_05640 [Paracoccaceae bacterium]|nr:hypothetical protein [Paracoccaceae bacterium]